MDLIARLPWWVGVALALLSYLLLHRIAAQPLPAAQPGQMGALMTQSIVRALALAGQYALPLLCLAGAGISAWRRRQRQGLLDEATGSDAGAAIDGMSWREFELLVGEGFRRRGFAVLESGGGGADGGVDLRLARGNERFVVQCKHWRAFKVGVEVVRQLYGVMAATGAAGGFVVSSGRFTDEASRFASGRNVELIDGPKLQALLREARMPAAASEPARDPSRPRRPGVAAVDAVQPSAPAPTAAVPPCPLCAGAMVRRLAKRGASAGAAFWGCSAYPGCRGTRRIA